MKNHLILFFCFFAQMMFAHDTNEAHIPLKQWAIASENKTVEASLMMLKDKTVYLEDAHHKVVKYPLSTLTTEDQAFVIQKYQHIDTLNNALGKTNKGGFWNLHCLFFGFIALLLGCYCYVYQKRTMVKYAYLFSMIGIVAVLLSFTPKPPLSTDPAFIKSAFAPFKPNVYTRWDATYFYVESKGIPDHPMMTGITGWQQQVPIPQCYTGANAWSIPLNPVIAATPVPVNAQHFLRGAIAVAVNGVVIFNPYTNTGVDAYLDGQLDNYGGHCGRADDYHYHTAPLSLYGQTSATLPIAFALDGFAVYGTKEPDGTNMQTLDANHGHYFNSVYHYHGTSSAPYMIGNMVGQVTEDATLQIIPQASASTIRPAGTPLSGAVITNCVANGINNGYNLTYTRTNQTYNVNYSWTTTGVYTFNFVSPTGTTTSTYNGFRQCSITIPVELTSFKGKAMNSTTLLNWQTASESNNKNFIIERSANGTDYTAIGEVKGNGTTATPHEYIFTDNTPSVGTNYYRLRQVDYDGKESLSKSVSIVFNKSGLSIKTTLTSQTLDVVVGNDKATTLRIFNVAGQEVFIAKVQGAQSVDIRSLPNGLYIIQTEKGETGRFVKD